MKSKKKQKHLPFKINGKIKKSDEALISVDDYGLNRGYGIFETIRLKDNKIIQIN
mgnify:CR=1 FL=1